MLGDDHVTRDCKDLVERIPCDLPNEWQCDTHRLLTVTCAVVAGGHPCDQNHDSCIQNPCDQNLVTRTTMVVTRIIDTRILWPESYEYDSRILITRIMISMSRIPMTWFCGHDLVTRIIIVLTRILQTLILWPESYGYDSCNQCPYDQNRNSCVQDPCEWPEPHCCSSSLSSRSWQTRSARWSCREEFHTCSWTWLSLRSPPHFSVAHNRQTV